jgi:hypothetical protein
VHGMHAATSKVENSAQGSSCKLKYVHGGTLRDVWACGRAVTGQRERDKERDVRHSFRKIISLSPFISFSLTGQREREREERKEGKEREKKQRERVRGRERKREIIFIKE